jgi:hypothetical protein
VEVVPTTLTDPAALKKAWLLQEKMGKTPIHSADQPGFVVNRYFVPWLNEAVRLLESGIADIPTIEAACKASFGVGMGPFELMNVTGIPIALHAATTLGEAFGPFYAPAARLRAQVAAGELWPLQGTPDASRFEEVSDRLWAGVFMVAAALVDQEVGSVEDVDIGARVGLRWPRGPFEAMNRMGVQRAASLVQSLARSFGMVVPAILADHAKEGRNFAFRLVRTRVEHGIATLTVDRPDALNALNETVVSQLTEAFRSAAADPDVRGIVIAGTGKAFIAGADIRFFVDNPERGDMDRIVSFTRAGHELLGMIDRCEKPVVARIHGLALGGGRAGAGLRPHRGHTQGGAGLPGDGDRHLPRPGRHPAGAAAGGSRARQVAHLHRSDAARGGGPGHRPGGRRGPLRRSGRRGGGGDARRQGRAAAALSPAPGPGGVLRAAPRERAARGSARRRGRAGGQGLRPRQAESPHRPAPGRAPDRPFRFHDARGRPGRGALAPGRGLLQRGRPPGTGQRGKARTSFAGGEAG